MTEPKHIAQSLKTILKNSLVHTILNRAEDITSVCEEVTGWWNYDLFKRKPSPAYNEYGIFQGTDLDLACFMYALSGRGAVINIPTYKTHTQSKIRTDQVLKSKDNRHGELLSVSANKYFFSFNINILDQNVIGEDKVGDYRTFSLTGKDGEWYEGWKTIQFEPTLKENRFITESKLWSGNRIVFTNFIHPNRWTSFFGHHYVISKMLEDRLTDQAAYLNTEVKRIKAAGVDFPSGKGPSSYDYDYGEGVQKKFVAFEAMIYIPDTYISGKYEKYTTDQAGLVAAYEDRTSLIKVINKLRFMTRASEYAHYINPGRMPSWIKNVAWEEGFKIPGKRIEWQRLKLFQPAVGQRSVSILKRTYTKSTRVAA
ncbi:MAG: hypothetical protein K9L62_10785 [Vallitaleaceae bacterium]|nr:hypothetical protein [Vallitaleaceae bacterium]